MAAVLGLSAFNKLHDVKPVLSKNTIYRSLRREVVLTRLRIGHTRLTHSYLLEREDQPFYIKVSKNFIGSMFWLQLIKLLIMLFCDDFIISIL